MGTDESPDTDVQQGLFGTPPDNNPDNFNGMDKHQDYQDQQQESSSSSPPETAPPTPSFSVDQVKDLISAAVREAVSQSRQPEPQAPAPELIDPEKYWTIPENLSPEQQSAELHRRMESFIERQTGDIRQENNQLKLALNLLNSRKADNPQTLAAHEDAVKLIQQGVVADYATAVELVNFRKQEKAGSARPLPPRSATSPNTQRGHTPTEKKKFGRMPTILEVMKSNPEIMKRLG